MQFHQRESEYNLLIFLIIKKPHDEFNGLCFNLLKIEIFGGIKKKLRVI